ncbi:hypothetical protein SAMN05421858_1822 [Haladaptatus litoreus]|uniref:Uncharacterized protein n=1 Tax=Haladaptatus litoreus TaxID=553468 RepID=A0A1N6Z164_9EURY|nr:hypothetical protein [Haladaptatus litoreus]SIR20583.1 hypothetical protein SAMN05421858_1822 [Haladaptatus litoreus]
MSSTDREIVAELRDRMQTLLLPDAVRLIEMNQAEVDDTSGVERDALETYLDEAGYGMDAFPSAFDESLTESDSWQSGRTVYELAEGRVSAFPPRWHEELRDTTDLHEYLRVICADMPDSDGDGTNEDSEITENGVAEQLLLDAVVAIGGMERDDARIQLKELRDEGKIEEYPSQHANPWVQLS